MTNERFLVRDGGWLAADFEADVADGLALGKPVNLFAW